MFIIVRHGNTFEAGEPPRRIGARTDLPLTAAGLAQAATLGAHFAAENFGFARVLTSPLARTRQTAAAILARLPAAPEAETAPWLREIDHGPDEDKPEAAVLARIGRDALAAWDRHAVPPADWIVDAEARIAAWRALFAEDRGPTLLVTSNGAARFALVAAGLAASAPLAGTMKLATGSYGIIDKDPNGVLTISEWGAKP